MGPSSLVSAENFIDDFVGLTWEIKKTSRLDYECWLIVLFCFLWSLLGMILIPGAVYYGPATTTTTFRPKYRDNGLRFYIISLVIAVPVIWFCNVVHLYYKFTTLIGILCVCGIALTVAVYLKGIFAPDEGGEHDTTGNPIFDIFCGVELYPNLLPSVSLKVLVNTRVSLILWQLVVFVAWKAHFELMGPEDELSWQMDSVTVLATAYLIKASCWEKGYMQTFDVNYERFGFIFTFGCLAIVPSLYTLPNTYLVENCRPSALNRPMAIVALILGIGSLVLSYLTDTQRTRVRATDGKCTVWNRPPKLIRATYLDEKGEERPSLLLASGFWGLARHMNYLFEAVTILALALPTLNYLPFTLVVVVVAILVHRTIRDDEKCARKYGKYWQQYKQLVPYRMVPGVF